MVWDSICHYDVCAVVGYLASWARVDVASLSFSDRWDDADDDSHYSTGSRVSHNSSKKSSDRLARHQESAQHHHRLSSSSSSARAAQHRTSGSTSLRQQQQHSSATYSYSSRSRAGAPTTSTDVARRMIMHVLDQCARIKGTPAAVAAPAQEDSGLRGWRGRVGSRVAVCLEYELARYVLV